MPLSSTQRNLENESSLEEKERLVSAQSGIGTQYTAIQFSKDEIALNQSATCGKGVESHGYVVQGPYDGISRHVVAKGTSGDEDSSSSCEAISTGGEDSRAASEDSSQDMERKIVAITGIIVLSTVAGLSVTQPKVTAAFASGVIFAFILSMVSAIFMGTLQFSMAVF